MMLLTVPHDHVDGAWRVLDLGRHLEERKHLLRIDEGVLHHPVHAPQPLKRQADLQQEHVYYKIAYGSRQAVASV